MASASWVVSTTSCTRPASPVSSRTLAVWPRVLGSDRLQRLVRLRRPLDADGIGRLHVAAAKHNAHDPRLVDQIPLRIVVEHGLLQSRLKAVELATRVAQAGD